MTLASGACGLDFGTSNSAIGHAAEAHPALIPLQEGRVSIPTAVFFSFEDASVTFGREAVSRYLQRENGRLMRSLKSVLGSSLIHEQTQVGAKRLRFDEIVSLFLSYVRNAADEPASVVMGRPVFFVDENPEADKNAEDQLRQAAQHAGFKHIEFQFEPIAAALDYERQVAAEELAFVVDIGGGTSDFSIVRVSPHRRGKPDRKSDILAYSGVHIGGTDFDRRLELDAVLPSLGLGAKLRHKNMETPSWWYQDLATWQRINFLYDSKIFADMRQVRRDMVEPEKLDRLLEVLENRKGHALLTAVEDVKIELSSVSQISMDLQKLAGIEPIDISRQQFERAIADQIDRIHTTIRSTLSQSNVSADAIGAVFLTGGSSRIPLLLATLREAFTNARIVEGDAFGSVATGLALEAHSRFGATHV
ncbi:Hsp70 family protein [Hyphomicrobium sulfonivorans]|uniref:Hsp70 family protein n=1 Tax=Hyphomicrobium sulfonivorans TaxID=121290 RepID=UPI00157073C7|nr:Hsp70 family protein [Hyphomicrobium sulfonivorans]MBI1650210.1 Hsp70 family protein [Hyphomicrobium sulfonivorans]NSL73127.1 heat-shock protein [Hyphomicrobium sulfonivorans]